MREAPDVLIQRCYKNSSKDDKHKKFIQLDQIQDEKKDPGPILRETSIESLMIESNTPFVISQKVETPMVSVQNFTEKSIQISETVKMVSEPE